MPAPCHTLAALFVKEGHNEKHNHSERENKLKEKRPFSTPTGTYTIPGADTMLPQPHPPHLRPRRVERPQSTGGFEGSWTLIPFLNKNGWND